MARVLLFNHKIFKNMTRKDYFIKELASLGECETQQMTIYFQLITSCPGLRNLTGKEIAHVASLMAHQKRYGYEQRISEEIEEEKLDKVDEQSNANALEAYRELKEKHPEALLLFRCGDSYEAWGEDASELAVVIGTGTFMEKGILKAGFYYGSLDTYLPKLIRSGHRVAIYDCPNGFKAS